MEKITYLSVYKSDFEKNELASREQNLRDSLSKEIAAFMTKFPIAWELVVADEPLKTRAENIVSALAKAEGDLVVIIDAELSTPLADSWALLRELVLDPQLDMVIGNRKTEKKKHRHQKSSWHLTLENIIHEKYLRQPSVYTQISDPLCPLWAIRKKALQKLSNQINKEINKVQLQTLRGWYYTPEILKIAKVANLRVAEFPILSQKQKPSQIPLLKEYWRHLF